MNIFAQLFKSFYSPKDIATFRFQGIGKTILFVFLLTFISILPNILYFSLAITNGVDLALETIEEKLPKFSIEDGSLKTELDRPITISENNFTILFDQTGAIEESDLKNSSNAIALLHDRFVLIAGGNIQEYPYAMLDSLVITKKDISSFLISMDSILFIMLPILFIIIYIFACGMKFIEVSVLAVIGLIIRNLLPRRIEYRHLWRLSAYAVALPTVFFTIMAFLKTSVPNGFILHWFVSIIILYLTLKEIPKPKEKQNG